jgi:hypothetical protein
MDLEGSEAAGDVQGAVNDVLLKTSAAYTER